MKSIGRLLGRFFAEVKWFLKDKPFIPCQVDWNPVTAQEIAYWQNELEEDLEYLAHDDYREWRHRFPNE